MPAGRAGDRDRVEVRGLEQDVGGGARDLGARAAHHAGQTDRAGVVGDQQVLVVEVAGDSVEGLDLLPRPCTADHDRPAQLRPVVGVRRLAQLEHHVVGDVHGQGDRTLAALLQPSAQPVRRRRGRVDPADREGVEAVAGRVLQADLVLVISTAVARGCRTARGRVDEVDVVGGRDLTGDAAHRQRVPTIGGDRDVEHLVVEAEYDLRIGADRGVRTQHDDPGVVPVGLAELTLGADHPVGDVAVGLARRDLESTRQNRTRQRDHHDVTDSEVARTADDAPAARTLTLRLVVLGADVDAAVPDVLLQLLGLAQLLDREHAARHQRSGQPGRARVDRLHLEAGRDDPLRDLTTRHLGGQVGDELSDPAQGRAHQASAPNGREKRTSPSTMSRMSSALLRNITVRSMPMPNAKPL